MKPAHVQLIVEISDSSLDYDLGRKAAHYASLGLADYWVVDAKRLVTRIHRAPAGDTYASVTEHASGEMLTPLALPVLAVRLTDLGLMPVAE